MLGQPIGSNTGIDRRVFVYEVAGLHVNDRTDQNGAPIRHSSTVSIPVSFSRMNEFMQRMQRLGGKIVAIRTASAIVAAPAEASEG
jgi:CpcD/allophycocyanin linker domain